MARLKKLTKPISSTLVIPAWVGWLYIVLAILLTPWIAYLAFTLPTHHRTANWDIVWTGFDIGLLLALVSTGITAYAKSIYMVVAASATGTLLLVDAWFDIISEPTNFAFDEALVLALVVELPLAFMSFYLADRTLRRHIEKKQP